MIGERFGKLEVIEYVRNNENGQKVWGCRCDCGNCTEVTTTNLNNGSTQNCGCGRKKAQAKENLVGQKFNHLTVFQPSSLKSSDGRFMWECRCDCGSEEIVLASSKDLKCNRKRSCSCLYNKKQNWYLDLTGQRFGLLTVVGLRRDLQKGDGQFIWECKCSCGNTAYVLTGNLRSGGTQSCGCLKTNPDSPYKNDEIFQRLLRIWTGIKKRCNNVNYEGYKHYGGRGIKVSSEWLSFRPFYKWSINNGYKKGLQIDRIDTNGDYEPSNCRWVTPKENSRNKLNNRKIEYDGRLMTIAELSEMSKLSKKTISDRLNRNWSVDDLLLEQRTKPNTRKYGGKKLTINGITKSFKEWADIIGINYATLRDRIKSGWTDDELLYPKGSKRKSPRV